jgi:hypothetical protein
MTKENEAPQPQEGMVPAAPIEKPWDFELVVAKIPSDFAGVLHEQAERAGIVAADMLIRLAVSGAECARRHQESQTRTKIRRPDKARRTQQK